MLLVNPGPLLDQAKEPMVLESITSRGLVRRRGSVDPIDSDLDRSAVRRPGAHRATEFVRILSPQRVTLEDLAGLVVDTHSVNLSGGGMLVSGQPGTVPMDTELQFSLDPGPMQGASSAWARLRSRTISSGSPSPKTPTPTADVSSASSSTVTPRARGDPWRLDLSVTACRSRSTRRAPGA